MPEPQPQPRSANESIIGNLSAATALLPPGKHEDALRSAVKKACGLQVELNDLHLARQTIDELAALDVTARTLDDQTSSAQLDRYGLIGHALYLSAILLYVRATEDRSRHKPVRRYAKRFDAELFALHDEVTKLRDDALAHWGPGPVPIGRPHNNVVAIVQLPIGPTSAVQTVATRANYKADVVDKLRVLLDAVIPAVRKDLVFAWSELQLAVFVMKMHQPGWEIPEFDEASFYSKPPPPKPTGTMRTVFTNRSS